MLEVKRIKNGALKRLVKDGDASKINPEWRRKVERILALLNAAADPSELDLPGFAYHQLKHDRKGTHSVAIQGNWRITFKWDDSGPLRRGYGGLSWAMTKTICRFRRPILARSFAKTFCQL
jgi:proteic killer suppression protein